MQKHMKDEVYGNSEDPWPYEYVVNALLFFSMETGARNEYIVNGFPEILFHGSEGDFTSSNAEEAVINIYSEIIGAGLSINDWIEDKSLEKKGLEELFSKLYSSVNNVEKEKVIENWKHTKKIAKSILVEMNWEPINDQPLFTCEKILNEYSYDAYASITKNA